MSATIIDGQKVARDIRQEVAQEVEQLRSQGLQPGLAVVLVGNDPASQIYVRNKENACREAGIYSRVYRLPEETTEEEVLNLVQELNRDQSIHGILVQVPLPSHISEEKVLYAISPEKDVDGFHPYNVGLLSIGKPRVIPCTPYGVMELLRRYNIETEGKEAVVIGRSNIVGKPMSMLLLQAHATVTTCHSRTQNLKEVTRRADILVAAIGQLGFVTPDMVKPGACVIDVGINRNAEGKVAGDVDPAVREVAGHLTPVPKGVGPMTIAMLLKNTLEAAKRQAQRG